MLSAFWQFTCVSSDEIRLDQSPAVVKRPGETVKISCGVGGVELTQTDSVLVKPGESFSISCVHSVELIQTGSTVLTPGQSLTLTCKVSGYSLTDSSYCTNWIRQPAGKTLEWIGAICGSGNTYYSEKLKSRFQVSRDTSSSTVTLTGQNMQTEDTAVYYCARHSQ
ncbi:hypothetical protein Q7C36_017086 [Tachysurus vachellii]|uniref:Ig-like domain-containing protein n=1 Tax=Tachysurus vachellii TaxID=175792 RepID=A0AA88M2R1_TACVA|nr:hypothetical protein Q7C36_017086 [Tachysurus vachellii]